MANTGYISSSGIVQKFTTGPYSGSFVTSSYVINDTLTGPNISTNQSFISGVLDSIQPCSNLPFYSRLKYDPINCPPPGLCLSPTMISSYRVDCLDEYNGNYIVSYSLNSTTSPYIIVQYSYYNDFNIILGSKTYSSSSNPSLDPILISSPTPIPSNIIYFRAYNSCSLSLSSSYSNIISASCNNITPTYSNFQIQLVNYTGRNLGYNNNLEDSNYYNLSNNNSIILNMNSDNIINLSIKANSLLGNNEGSLTVSGSSDYSNIITTVNTHGSSYIINDYTSFLEPYFIQFDNVQGTVDVSINIDRTNYYNNGIITYYINNLI